MKEEINIPELYKECIKAIKQQQKNRILKEKKLKELDKEIIKLKKQIKELRATK